MTVDRRAQIVDEYETLEHQLADPEVLADPAQLRDVSKRYNDLGPVVEKVRRYNERSGDAEAARQMLDGSSGDERQMLVDEIEQVTAELAELDVELREMMIPKDPHDGRDVIVEIRGAEGGEEANLFARDLYEMYEAYAGSQKWKLETLSSATSDMGGYNDITFVVHGDTAWRHLKYEGGPHRVQRVPVTESQGRVHTSSATVSVLADVDDVDVEVDERDLEIDVYRSSGAGGQHVNTTDSAVRITHVPTGVVVTMQDERSQLQNRNRAMQVLRARLFERAEAERAAELSSERRSQIGGGGRSEKIRTYNYKENRVTDHRIGFTIYRLSDILGGDLDLVVNALATEERARLLAEGPDDDVAH
ncbi:peptide chain release factor 1 [Ilumatobacter nonamiensis]|uniref:peptide chain release factor 1 n=1 Tax=Ilumatobacter nonamiensis TaxID=467093 RepID=UPI000349905A|nr:peptide chain release factor 1 [Ilumatobacter nonamiensis]